MMTQEQMDELVSLLVKRLEPRLNAVARAVTSLADGLSSAERRRLLSDQEIQDALISILAVTGDALNLLRDELQKLPIETLANLLHYTTINKVRDFQYRRGDVPAPAPLPPVPVTGVVPIGSEDSLVLAKHTENSDGSREDSSVTFSSKKGSSDTRIDASVSTTKLKEWAKGTAVVVVGVGMFVWNIYLQIKHATGK